MKTKEQILKWLDAQPWANEFYKAVFMLRETLNFSYSNKFIFGAFPWEKTEQGFDVWAKRDKEFCEWYDSKPTSWEEYCEQNPIMGMSDYYIAEDCSIQSVGTSSLTENRDVDFDANVMSKDLCEAFLAYMKLIQLRNAWVKDCDAEDCSIKIVAKDNAIFKDSYMQFMHGLSFPTHKMADDFMDTFEDLLEVAKPLL